jgi:hypothetical protein
MDNRSQIIKIHSGVYSITCAACGEIAVSLGEPQVIRSVIDEAFVSMLGKDYFLYQGITGTQNIPAQFVEEVIKILDADDLKALNFFLVNSCGFTEGMDAYCYQCDCVYCREHYKREVMFDECFYDYTIGTCPRMHRRKIDD